MVAPRTDCHRKLSAAWQSEDAPDGSAFHVDQNNAQKYNFRAN
jgi:hypothetical protein